MTTRKEKSKGHIGFTKTHEYFRFGNDVYRAPISDYVGTDGYRAGARFESTGAAWPEIKTRISWMTRGREIGPVRIHTSKTSFGGGKSYRDYPTRVRAFKDDIPEPECFLKIDAIVREYTGYRTLAEMCKNKPTLRAPPGASQRTKKYFAILRKAYKRVTGKEAHK